MSLIMLNNLKRILIIEKTVGVNTTHYRIISQSKINSIQKFNNPPPNVSIANIKKITNIANIIKLKKLEKKYDDFLERNQQLLLLHNEIDNYLEIRDIITSQICKLERSAVIKQHMDYKALQQKYGDPDKQKCEYNHSFQSLLPVNLRLTTIQISQGYIPFPNEPKEFNCGCLTMKYYVHKNISDSEHELNTPIIKLNEYCIQHQELKKKEEELEATLKLVKKEISGIKRHSNSLDFEDYKNSKFNKRRRISEFPWKNN